jgi:hypothetical protein
MDALDHGRSHSPQHLTSGVAAAASVFEPSGLTWRLGTNGNQKKSRLIAGSAEPEMSLDATAHGFEPVDSLFADGTWPITPIADASG